MSPQRKLTVGLRGRLLAVFLAMMLLASLASTALISRLLAARSREGLDGYLNGKVAEFLTGAVTASTPEELRGFAASFFARAGYDPAELVLLLRTADGVVVSSAPALGLETSPQVRMLLDRGDGEAWIQTARGGARVAVRTVRVDGAVAGAYLVARFTDALDRNRTAMVRLFLLVLLGTLVAAGAIGYGLAGRALASLRQIARTARLISREDLTRRIGYRGAHDEVGTLAATLDEMLERLEAAFAEQQQFLSDVSHELRTPMQVIKGHLEVLRRLPQTDPQEVRETLTLVLEEVDRMAKLTTQLLTLARARAAPARQPLVLRPFLEEILRKAQTLAPRRFALQADADIIVTVDRDALTQIMLNLLQNAVDNTSPEDGITIGAAADHHEFRLWVADTGRGIPPEAMDHLFDRFYRVGENGGSGLGLAIVDALARAHGGRVHARSRLGEGSTFEVILPRE